MFMETSMPGLFAAGDVRHKFGQKMRNCSGGRSYPLCLWCIGFLALNSRPSLPSCRRGLLLIVFTPELAMGFSTQPQTPPFRAIGCIRKRDPSYFEQPQLAF